MRQPSRRARAASLSAADLGDGSDGPDRRGLGQRLAEVPPPFFLAHVDLQGAPRHVEADGVAIDDLVRSLRREVGPARAYRGDQPQLLLVILRRPWVTDA